MKTDIITPKEALIEDKYPKSKQLEVVRAEFQCVDSLSLDEMIDGFDELYAITYSSSKVFYKISHI